MSVPWNKGKKGIYHHSEEIKQLIRAGKLGKNNPNYGKHFSEETRKKMGDSRRGSKNPNFGKPRSDYVKKRLSETHRGKKLTEEHKKILSLANKGKKLSPEHIEALRKANLGKVRSEESNQKNREKHLGKILGPLSEEHKNKISIANVGRKMTEEQKAHMRKPKPTGFGEMRRRIMLNRSPEIIRKCLLRREKSSLEKHFEDIINKLHLPYKFVGNGEFFIERKNPDFINTNNEKIAIEVYSFYHKEHFYKDRGGFEKWKNDRIELFGKYGWRIEFFEKNQLTEEEISKRLG